MPQNIKLNYTRNLDCKLLFDNYFDFMLYKGEAFADFDPSECAIADFTDWNMENGKVYSSVAWDGAYNSGVTMEDIGLTGTDNGLISFDKDVLTNEQILNILTGTTIEIPEGDNRFFLSPITGNTKEHTYPMFFAEDEKEGKYVAFKGGFWQGFYKLYGFDYQTLPNGPDYEWNLYFRIRPRTDYEVEPDTLNEFYPNNKGIFFYMGTRAENKFWQYYNTDSEVMDKLKEVPDDENYFMNQCEEGDVYDPNYDNSAHIEYLAEEEPVEEEKEPEYFIDAYVTNDESLYGVYDYTLTYKDLYFDNSDGYFSKVYDVLPDKDINGYTGETTYHGEYGKNEHQHLWNGNRKKYPHESACEKEPKKSCCGKKTYTFGIYELYTYGYAENNLCCHTCSCESKPDKCDVTVNDLCCCCDEYYNQCKNYFRDNYFKDFECPDTDKAIEDAYFGKEVEIKPENITTSLGHSILQKGYYEIVTDNKFLIFDRTKHGYTTSTWDESFGKMTLYGRNDWGNVNLFLLMNRTKTGWTTDTIQEYYEANTKEYDIYKDIKNNVFALRIRDDGAIGYRYGVLDCESGDPLTNYSVKEEYSLSGIVKSDQWNDITVKIKVINPMTITRDPYRTAMLGYFGLKECNPYKGKRKMRIYIYVNGYLKLISKELNEFNFRQLDEIFQKQEAVPYNMSLGGGSQGLAEAIYPDVNNRPPYILPIERDFAGTFIGDIKSFKLYDCQLGYLTIRNYLSKNKIYRRKIIY